MQRTRDNLYERFRNGDRPDENDFRDLIDSFFNIEDDSLNAGWYYQRFIPVRSGVTGLIGGSTPAVSLPGEPIVTEHETYIQGGRFAGIMMIFLPKRITRISGFYLKAYMELEDLGSERRRPFFSCRIHKMPRNIITGPISNLDSWSEVIFSETFNGTLTGFQPIEQELSIDEPINSEEDSIFIQMFADSRIPGNKISIRLIGTQYV